MLSSTIFSLPMLFTLYPNKRLKHTSCTPRWENWSDKCFPRQVPRSACSALGWSRLIAFPCSWLAIPTRVTPLKRVAFSRTIITQWDWPTTFNSPLTFWPQWATNHQTNHSEGISEIISQRKQFSSGVGAGMANMIKSQNERKRE